MWNDLKESVCGVTEALSRDLPAGTFDTYEKHEIVRRDSNQPVKRNKRKRLDSRYAFFEQGAQNGRTMNKVYKMDA
jgi:hypothetical protein